jgi:hypothetical protein
MFQDNHFYGHAHIMARYAGFNDQIPPRIPGHLQHDWNTYCKVLPEAWRFVWNDRNRRRAGSLRQRAYVTGAPWNYLLAMEPAFGGVPEEEREGTLWFLFGNDHQRMIAEIRETEPGPVTISLDHAAYERPEIRQAYQDAGFRVITCGERGGWDYENPDRTYLYDLLAELRRHRRVASDRLCTNIFYGISVGCVPAVYGDQGGFSRIHRLWPELIGKELDLAQAQTIAAEELGRGYLAAPEELCQIFDWTSCLPFPAARGIALRALPAR